MAPLLGLETVFMEVQGRSRAAKLIDYGRLFLLTIGHIRQFKPDVIWIQVPQTPPIWAALLYRRLFDRRAKVVADCHNAAFRPPWSRFPAASWSLGACDAILVHNDTLVAEAARMSGNDRVFVLEDVPARDQTFHASASTSARPLIVFPCSIADDEPLEEVVAAARMAPDMDFAMTGKVERFRERIDTTALPPNLLLPGFLPLSEFDALLRRCDVMLGLTKVDGIQLSVCNEAIGFGKPMVLSDTSLLRRLFGKAGVFADSSDPARIVAACRDALNRRQELSNASRMLAAEREEAWLLNQVKPFIAYLKELRR